MEPFAYGLRDGPWLEKPDRIDRTTIRRPTPDAFKPAISSDALDVLPLVKDTKAEHAPGWCTYADVFDSPEMEYLCGGINHKTATAAAVWRQGNLLHFGFDVTPDEMNDRGRGLLVHSIVYIAGFTEDRPITDTPDRALLRVGADRVVAKKNPDKGYIEWYFTPAVRKQGKIEDWPAFQDWYRKNRAFLRADRQQGGSLVLDEEAKEFGTATNQPEFFPAAIASLKEGGAKAERAATLLSRYAPLGPKEMRADDWQRWWDENKSYVFFSESGWYRWYLDPLARRRGVASAELRGSARATPAKK
jgi:hypothetical protein